ncbi:hypothetical protein [Sinorhizobium meliloti]|uniref:hypothetical protein n=1 Tax=Rhizobium meliloti TaxID=382 RepID=UPI0019116160
MLGMGIFSHAPTAAYERSGPETEGSPEAIIEFICRPCHRHCALERKLLVKAFGAGMTFAVIRRAWRWAASAYKRRRVTNAARTSHVWAIQIVLMEARP